LDESSVRIRGVPLIKEKVYTLGGTEFIALGGDGYSVFGTCRIILQSEDSLDCFKMLDNY